MLDNERPLKGTILSCYGCLVACFLSSNVFVVSKMPISVWAWLLDWQTELYPCMSWVGYGDWRGHMFSLRD